MTELKAQAVNTASVAAHLVKFVTGYCDLQGLPSGELMASVGIDVTQLKINEARLPYSQFSELCLRASAALNDPFFGLHVGESVKPGHLGSHGFGLISCDTVRELLQRSLRYSCLVMDAYRNEIKEHDNHCIRYWRSAVIEKHTAKRLQLEMNMALWVTLARWITGRPEANPVWVSFEFAAPENNAEYLRLFRCPLKFGEKDTAVAFPSELLDLALPQANQSVRKLMDALCERLLVQLGAQSDPVWLTHCRKAIVLSFEQGVPEITEIAKQVGMSSAELAHQLARRKLSFRALLEAIRRELALGYIKDSTLSLADIAYLLGFSEQSSFQRAFKRWTGKTPGEFRLPC